MTLTPLVEMETVLDALVTNAESLKKLSMETVTTEELTKLQETQEGLLADLIKKDRAVQKLGTVVHSEPAWQSIQNKLEGFSKLNETFIENLSVRKGLIQFEIQEVKKTRQSLGEMKSRYGTKPSDGKKRINKLS